MFFTNSRSPALLPAIRSTRPSPSRSPRAEDRQVAQRERCVFGQERLGRRRVDRRAVFSELTGEAVEPGSSALADDQVGQPGLRVGDGFRTRVDGRVPQGDVLLVVDELLWPRAFRSIRR